MAGLFRIVKAVPEVVMGPLHHRTYSWFSFAAIGLALLSTAGILISVLPAGAAGTVAVVQVPHMNLRPSPNLKGDPVMVLPKGSRVRILRHLDGWVEVSFKSKKGYLRNQERYIHIETSPAVGSPPARETKQIVAKKAKAKAIDRRINDSRKEVVTYTRQEAKMVAGLDGIERTVDGMRKKAAATRRDLEALDKDISGIRRSIEGQKAQIQKKQDYAATRLVALYKLNWLGRAQMLGSASTMQELLERERALSVILSNDARVLQELNQDHDRLIRKEQALVARQQKKKSVKRVHEKQLRQLSREKNRRSRLLGDIRKKKSLKLAAIRSLEQSARELDKTIAALAAKLKRDQQAAAAQKSPNASKKQSFSKLKGLLIAPVTGNIVSEFGEYRNERYDVKNFRSGVDIRADFGEPVRAVSAGRVLYADWFQGYGNMLIIDHGDHYYTVYAHVEASFKNRGDLVESGEVIATVGDTGSLVGPKLHFEVRHRGTPLDPTKWIKGG
jgi:septal ring factor EnvC (AmiA/AmiB activator)